VDTHLNVRLFPVGYYLWLDEERARAACAPRRGAAETAAAPPAGYGKNLARICAYL
jgi:hypothetical protein